MEIKANGRHGPALAATMGQVRMRSTQIVGDAISFARIEALNEALRPTPRVRPDHVAQARQFIGQPNYPPDELIQGIATLLARNLDALSPA